MAKLYYVHDEGPTRHYPTLEEARADAEIQIDVCRENCDPEWPMSTESIGVYECNAETEYPDEDGRLVLIATEVDVRMPDEGDTSVEYWCDYKMLPPAALAKEPTP